MDWRFIVVALLSVVAHVVLMYHFARTPLPAQQPQKLEQISERFAKLIIEKPLPKLNEKKNLPKGEATSSQTTTTTQEPVEPAAQSEQRKAVEQAAAQKAVTSHTARVEQKIRTVGVLGMLTGTGTTAKGPAVVDVLGAVQGGKERFQDLESALDNMTGLQRTADAAVAQKPLVKSKEVSLGHTESIDHLIAGIGSAQTAQLEKKGAFIVEKPESIEGAASASAKRDFKAINKVVMERKMGINMTYQKYLKRDPALGGKITVRFTIAASGEVVSVDILENTTGSAEFEEEIARKVRMWQFEAIAEGDATVTFPFVFRPS
jgi:TonB family protein